MIQKAIHVIKVEPEKTPERTTLLEEYENRFKEIEEISQEKVQEVIGYKIYGF